MKQVKGLQASHKDSLVIGIRLRATAKVGEQLRKEDTGKVNHGSPKEAQADAVKDVGIGTFLQKLKNIVGYVCVKSNIEVYFNRG